jgi:nucleoside-diphosphate-sugar epimerase
VGRRPGPVEDVVATMTANPLAPELDRIVARTGELWEDLRGARLFVTGGTGFFGCWLLETFLWANDHLKLGASATVLTRNGRAFAWKAPHLASHKDVTLLEGDVRTFTFPDAPFSHVIHAGTDTGPASSAVDRQRVFDTIVDGTRRTLDLARAAGARRFLLTSTGAIYGRQPAGATHVAEDYAGSPDPADPALAGAEATRAAEMLCAMYADARLAPTIARCFGFIGPYLPLESQQAAGNFIRDGMRGGPIRVLGDGTAYRSYMYTSDLAIWLWTILLRGAAARPYNVGSEEETSIVDLAHAVARRFTPEVPVHVARTAVAGALAGRYVPSTLRARTELGLAMTVILDEALMRTVAWHRDRATVTDVNN